MVHAVRQSSFLSTHTLHYPGPFNQPWVESDKWSTIANNGKSSYPHSDLPATLSRTLSDFNTFSPDPSPLGQHSAPAFAKHGLHPRHNLSPHPFCIGPHTSHRPTPGPGPTSKTLSQGACSCITCFCIRNTNHHAAAGISTSLPVRTVGVILVAAVHNNPAVLLARNESEVAYGLTAGPRYFVPTDKECYEIAARRILWKDANIPFEDSRRHIRFFGFRRLPTGTPVLIGSVEPTAIHSMDFASNFFDDANTKLFRINTKDTWRVSGTSDYKLIQASVRELLATVDMHFLSKPSYHL